RAGRVQQEPADERKPQSAESSAVEETKQTHNDENKSDRLSSSRCDARGATGVAVNPPYDRPQNATTIERKTRNHVENSKRDIDDAKPNEHRSEEHTSELQ